jgi:hypothetical protein
MAKQRKKKGLPTPKTSNVDYDRITDRENRDPREPPDEFVTDAEIGARELEQRTPRGRSKKT